MNSLRFGSLNGANSIFAMTIIALAVYLVASSKNLLLISFSYILISTIVTFSIYNYRDLNKYNAIGPVFTFLVLIISLPFVASVARQVGI